MADHRLGRMVGSSGGCDDATSSRSRHIWNGRTCIESLCRYPDRFDEERRVRGVVFCHLGFFPTSAVSRCKHRAVQG